MSNIGNINSQIIDEITPSVDPFNINGNTNIEGDLDVTGTINANISDPVHSVDEIEQLNNGFVQVNDDFDFTDNDILNVGNMEIDTIEANTGSQIIINDDTALLADLKVSNVNTTPPTLGVNLHLQSSGLGGQWIEADTDNNNPGEVPLLCMSSAGNRIFKCDGVLRFTNSNFIEMFVEPADLATAKYSWGISGGLTGGFDIPGSIPLGLSIGAAPIKMDIMNDTINMYEDLDMNTNNINNIGTLGVGGTLDMGNNNIDNVNDISLNTITADTAQININDTMLFNNNDLKEVNEFCCDSIGGNASSFIRFDDELRLNIIGSPNNLNCQSVNSIVDALDVQTSSLTATTTDITVNDDFDFLGVNNITNCADVETNSITARLTDINMMDDVDMNLNDITRCNKINTDRINSHSGGNITFEDNLTFFGACLLLNSQDIDGGSGGTDIFNIKTLDSTAALPIVCNGDMVFDSETLKISDVSDNIVVTPSAYQMHMSSNTQTGLFLESDQNNSGQEANLITMSSSGSRSVAHIFNDPSTNRLQFEIIENISELNNTVINFNIGHTALTTGLGSEGQLGTGYSAGNSLNILSLKAAVSTFANNVLLEDTLFMDTLALDETVTEILVRDTSASNEIKYRTVGNLPFSTNVAPNFNKFGSAGESTTTSTSYQQKVGYTTSSLTSGTYCIAWKFELTNSGATNSTQARVDLNNGTTLIETVTPTLNTVNVYMAFCGGSYEGLVGVNTIDIDYRAVSAGTAKIKNAFVNIWRVE
jgi:hypothetical protein